MDDQTRRTIAAALLVADDLDRRGYRYAGVIRRLATLAAQAPRPAMPGDCPVCATPITQPTRGRPRTYCTDRCKRTAAQAKRRRNASLNP